MDIQEWINARRIEMGISKRELCHQAGITEVTLWNLLNHRHKPIQRTRDAILGVIGEIPEEEDDEIEARPDNEIEAPLEEIEVPENPNVGNLISCNHWDEADRPEGGGVYIFVDRTDRPVYIGKSGNIRGTLRDRYHSRRARPYWIQQYIVPTMWFIPIEDAHIRAAVESAMIASHRGTLLFNTVGI
jgi:transcriptional regulator with XRE-family HTH domain